MAVPDMAYLPHSSSEVSDLPLHALHVFPCLYHRRAPCQHRAKRRGTCVASILDDAWEHTGHRVATA
eukprot:854258-Rhodomonas_salina.1